MKNRIVQFLTDWPDGSRKPSSVSNEFAQRWAERMADLILNPKVDGPKSDAMIEKLGEVQDLSNLGKLANPDSPCPCVATVYAEGEANQSSVSLELEVILGTDEARLVVDGLPSGDSVNTYMMTLDRLRAFHNAITDLLNDPTATYLLTSAIQPAPTKPVTPATPEPGDDREDGNDAGEEWKSK